MSEFSKPYRIWFYDEYSDEGGDMGIVAATREDAVRAVERSYAEIAADQPMTPLTWTGDLATTVWSYQGHRFTARYTLLRGADH